MSAITMTVICLTKNKLRIALFAKGLLQTEKSGQKETNGIQLFTVQELVRKTSQKLPSI